jgi:hypothetical protein
MVKFYKRAMSIQPYLKEYRAYLKDNNFLNETFDYDELQIDGIQYKDIHARHIFLEGFGHQFIF